MEEQPTDLAALLPGIAGQMRGLLSNLYLAAAQAIPAERREQDAVLDSKAAVLEQSFYRLLRMVNGISATEYLSEKSTLSLRDTDIVQLVSAVCEASGDLAEMLGIRLRFVCAMERCICAADAAALEQALYQLLSNALKYTPKKGTVTVELKRSGKQLLLSVADTGCGIPSEQMGHLFDRCLRPRRACRTGARSGTGTAAVPEHRAKARRRVAGRIRPRKGEPVYAVPA